MIPNRTLLHAQLSCLKIILVFPVFTLLLTGCMWFEPDDFKPEIQPIIEYGLLNHGRIEGIKYETNTLSGTTTSAGRFSYRDNETITFKVGDIELATMPVHANFTLLDFDPNYDRSSDSYIPSDRVINILQFLHTISNTNNRDINITSIIHNAAQGLSVNFDQSNAAFSSDPDVLYVVNHITAVRDDGVRTLQDPVSVQILLTENLSFRYGNTISWNDYLNLDNGNQWNYARTIIQDAAAPVIDNVYSFLLISAWNNQKVWVQGWSDNWKPDEFGFIGEYYFNIGLVPANTQNFPNASALPGSYDEILYSLYVPGKWLFYSNTTNGVTTPVHIKIEGRGNYEVSGINYSNVLKQTILQPGSDTLIERWYAPGTGMIKELTTTSTTTTTTQQTVELLTLDLTNTFPDTETVNMFLGLKMFYDFIISGNNEVFSQLADANEAVLAYYLVFGEIGSPDHIDAFHAMYNVILSDHAVNVFNTVTELNNTYGLDSDTTGNLINFHYNESLLYILAFASAFNFDSPELTQTVVTNIHNIYQNTINLLVDQGSMQAYELSIYSDIQNL